MKFRTLQGTPLKISEVGFGVWTVGTTMWGVAQEDYQTGVQLLQKALDLGVNFFDTADVYGDGKGETILAQAFPKATRDQVVIATKFGYDFYNHPGVQPGQRERPHNWSPAFIRMACEKSLQRLKTDRIDFYQLHNPRIETIRNDDVFHTLDRARDGKQSITAVVDALLKDYQFGLGLIRKNTGQTEFEIPLAALDAPDKFLSEWVVSSYKKA
mgnify:CR=1 FL=1